MKERFVVPALLLVALFVNARTEARDRTEDLQKTIQAASGVLSDQSASRDQIQGALIRLLDAAVLILPQSEHAADARSNLEAARAELEDRFQLNEKVHRHLDLAYRALNAGKSFQFPEVHSMEDAKAYIQSLFAAAIAGLEKGQDGQASRLLLECVIMVITPIPR